MKLSEYVFKRLEDLGIDNVFCIPGESVQELYRALINSPLNNILLSHEPSAGYATDAYSRLKGIGAVLVSYGVGSLNMVNAVSQAYAESSPMIVLSGGPGMAERKKYSLLHHKVRTFQTQQRVFDEITAASLIIESPEEAAIKLETAFQTALRYKKPVYVEIPRDICNCKIGAQPILSQFDEDYDADTVKEALEEVVELLNKAQKPVILAGVEVSRIKMQDKLIEFIEKTGLPVCTTLLGKSLVSESHPQSLGTFFGTLSNKAAGHYLESSDLILSLGSILSDVNLGMFTFQFDRTKMIEARIDHLRVKHHHYPEMTLKNCIQGLLEHKNIKKRNIDIPKPRKSHIAKEIPSERITVNNAETVLNKFINRDNTPTYRIVSDVGDCLFLTQGLHTNTISSFLSPAYYLSMGFAVPGGIGAQIADPSQRSLIVVGDGAFQMTGMEIISATRLGLNPIIVVLNNGVYATLDKVELDPLPESYKIGKYEYFKMAEIFGGIGLKADTTDEFEKALNKAEKKHSNDLVLIQLNLDENDVSDVLKSFGAKMGQSNQEASSIE
ncbi:MAG: thiamine pyrophosphate-binding protein [Candidatus Caenarcaniphilales bacterium]|nr:thiamine pyrophosphate-binding protein [Candidatus Caenarcaniphilales bacterium]